MSQIAACRSVFPAKKVIESTELRTSLKSNKNIRHIICHRNANLGFALTENKTIVLTSSGAFLLEPLVVSGDLWRRRLMKIRRLILARKVRNYNELIELCRPGIVMTFVKLEWYV